MTEPQGERWLVLRTKSRHENVVESILLEKQITSYLPKRKVVKTWQGHKRTVDMPLFPGYLFVSPRAHQYESMRYIRGSCGLVMAADSKPATLPEKDMWTVKKLVDSDAPLTVEPEFVAGQRVKIIAGPLMGVEGDLVWVKSQVQLVINVDWVSSSVRVEVDKDCIELV